MGNNRNKKEPEETRSSLYCILSCSIYRYPTADGLDLVVLKYLGVGF